MFINVAQYKSICASLWHFAGEYWVYIFNSNNVQVAVKSFAHRSLAVAWREINGPNYAKQDKKN